MASSAEDRAYRPPFTFRDAFNYDKDTIYKSLEDSILHNNQLGTEERDELTKVWDEIINKQRNGTRKGVKAENLRVHVHGVEVPVASIFCAISAVLPITLKAPDLHSQIPYHNWAFALAVVLGKWCIKVDVNKSPRMICVIYGISSSNPSASTLTDAPTTIIAMCGTTKGLKSKKGWKKWREERQNFLHNAIGMFPGRKYLEEGGFPPITTETRNEFLLEAGDNVTSNRILDEFLQSFGSFNSKCPKQRFGDCAETIPMAVIAERCSGHVVLIAMTLTGIENVVKGINLDNTIVIHDQRRESQPELQQSACNICKWEFSALKVIRNITILDNIQIGAVDSLNHRLQ